MSKFEDELIDRFKEKGIQNSSISLYIKNLRKLNNGELESFKFLEKPEIIMEKLKDYKPTTQRNFLISIVSALSMDNTPKYKKLYSKYYDIMILKNNEVKEIKHSAVDLPEWKSIIEKWEELEKEVNKFKGNKTISNIEYETLLKFVVLSLYTLQPPRRNGDYLNMYIIDKQGKDDPEDINYVVIKTAEFIFNNYKTSHKYNQQVQKISSDLCGVLKIYFKFHPHLKSGKIPKEKNMVKFLVYRDGEEITQINAITRILNSVLGKGTASSKLRHIYLTSKYGDTIKEQEKDAEAMGHSTAQQKEYIYA